MALVTVTRSEPVSMVWSQGQLLITGATLNLAVNMDAAAMERMNRGHEGVGTADVTIIDWEDGV